MGGENCTNPKHWVHFRPYPYTIHIYVTFSVKNVKKLLHLDKISQQVACYNIALLECVCGHSAHVYIFVMMCLLLAGRSCRPGLGWQQQQARPGTRGFSLKLCLLTLCHRCSPDPGHGDMLLGDRSEGGHYTCTPPISQAVFRNRYGTQASVEYSNQ